eukprot:TRINITY_DN68132_c2_g2_i9.p1 TRINITY_DN68132_c2_g2~~TRINITY_DN68132_c2_g2_i9.p1  ORF type:complete len:312 (+),score=6.43 TRINITY_DN68132_c2_g2_i9:32-967(+)
MPHFQQLPLEVIDIIDTFSQCKSFSKTCSMYHSALGNRWPGRRATFEQLTQCKTLDQLRALDLQSLRDEKRLNALLPSWPLLERCVNLQYLNLAAPPIGDTTNICRALKALTSLVSITLIAAWPPELMNCFTDAPLHSLKLMGPMGDWLRDTPLPSLKILKWDATFTSSWAISDWVLHPTTATNITRLDLGFFSPLFPHCKFAANNLVKLHQLQRLYLSIDNLEDDAAVGVLCATCNQLPSLRWLQFSFTQCFALTADRTLAELLQLLESCSLQSVTAKLPWGFSKDMVVATQTHMEQANPNLTVALSPRF